MGKVYMILLLLCLGFNAFAQHGTIKGKITVPEADALFVNVGLKGTNLGTTSNEHGHFEIRDVPEGEYVLRASMVGYVPHEQTVIVAEGKVISVIIQLKEQTGKLGEVVVTGNMRETYVKESPVPVEVYTASYFRKSPVPAVFEALNMVNGVQPQINCNVCGTGDIHINGLEGAYTMVLIDGMPMVSALSTVYGLSGIPNSLIDRVEVIKGPASTLYGSEAVAGLINIITKSPLKAPAFTADVFYTSHQELNTDVGLSRRWGKAATLWSANYFRFQNRLDRNEDNFTDIPLQHRISVFNKWNLNRRANREASLALRYYYEDRFGGEMQWSPAYRAGDEVYGESVYTSRYEVFGTYQLPLQENVRLSFSFNNHDQNSAYGTLLYKARQRVSFGQLIWDKALGNHKLLTGATYRYTYYDDNTPATATYTDGSLRNNPDHSYLPGIFVQDEYKASDAVILVGGLRYDYNTDHGNIFTPRFNLKWTPDNRNTLRFNLGNGYRVVNLFAEDHAALSGAREVVIRNELAPETSYNGTFNYQHYLNLPAGYLDLEFSAFYTYFTNKIIADLLTDNNLIIYDNLLGYAISKGVALNGELAFRFPLQLNAGVTLMDVYQVEKGDEGQKKVPQLHAPNFSATFAGSYKLKSAGVVFDYTGNIKGPMYLPVQEQDFRPGKSPWFTIQNVQVTKVFGGGLEIYGGVKNIFNFVPKHPLMRPFDPFDKQVEENNPNNYTFDTAYNYSPLQGRRTFVGMRYSLGNR